MPEPSRVLPFPTTRQRSKRRNRAERSDRPNVNGNGHAIPSRLSTVQSVPAPSVVRPRAELNSITLAEVTPESVGWLWPGYLPLGKLTVLEGDPGLSKSTVMLDWAARLSSGTA